MTRTNDEVDELRAQLEVLRDQVIQLRRTMREVARVIRDGAKNQEAYDRIVRVLDV